MKKIILFSIFAFLISCKKNGENTANIKSHKAKEIDSINEFREKRNDSISILNQKNKFRDLSGNHVFSHSSIPNKGSVNFKNAGRDLYTVSGNVKSGNDYAKIEGEIKMVSEEYLNFTGKITQSIQENDGGKPDVRTKKTSFARKGNQKYWRLQNRINNAGFSDNIDIYN